MSSSIPPFSAQRVYVYMRLYPEVRRPTLIKSPWGVGSHSQSHSPPGGRHPAGRSGFWHVLLVVAQPYLSSAAAGCALPLLRCYAAPHFPFFSKSKFLERPVGLPAAGRLAGGVSGLPSESERLRDRSTFIGLFTALD